MRWLFHNPDDPREAEEHKRVLSRIDAWWAEFALQTERLDAVFRQRTNWDVVSWMDEQLRQINPQLMWEFGPGQDEFVHRLTITCETHSELRPMLNDLIGRAPQLEGWQFLAWRPARALETVQASVRTQLEVDLNRVEVAVSTGEYNRIDLAFRWPQLPSNEEKAFDAAFVATELLLGEEAVDRWVGLIELTDASTPAESGRRFLPLERLQPTFQALVGSVRDQLPQETHATRAEDLEWALLELTPGEAADYSDRDDLLTAITCNADLLGATFADAPFHSERYSCCGERFCYLKIDGTDLSGVTFRDREQLEEAVRSTLMDGSTGAMIGSGTGLRYSYIELALTDVGGAVRAIQNCLRQGNIPQRSWLLFHDADLESEWIAIGAGAPPPPQTG